MIHSHFHLSCYALEHPFRAYYSYTANMIELIDINNDVYQFRLPDYEHYEVNSVLSRKWKSTALLNNISGTTLLASYFTKAIL